MVSNNTGNMQREVRNTFGSTAQNQNENPPVKENVMVFRKDRVYVSLDLKSYFDEKRGAYGDPSPRLTTSADGVFFNLPADAQFLKAYGEFMMKLSEALDGIKIDNTVINADVAEAKKKLQRFRGAA